MRFRYGPGYLRQVPVIGLVWLHDGFSPRDFIAKFIPFAKPVPGHVWGKGNMPARRSSALLSYIGASVEGMPTCDPMASKHLHTRFALRCAARIPPSAINSGILLIGAWPPNSIQFGYRTTSSGPLSTRFSRPPASPCVNLPRDGVMWPRGSHPGDLDTERSAVRAPPASVHPPRCPSLVIPSPLARSPRAKSHCARSTTTARGVETMRYLSCTWGPYTPYSCGLIPKMSPSCICKPH